MADRIIDAAKDGYVDMLRQATKRELNSPDEDGMTATSWAARSGNLEALRLIVGRQGDVNVSDYLGLTPLHHASQTGQFDVVCFLVNYGCNILALDNDHHSALDIAAINNRDDIINYLDSVIAQRRTKNPKQFAKQREEAARAAESNIRRYEKLQEAAERRAAKEQRRLSQQTIRQEAEGDRAAKPGFFKAISLRISGQGGLQKSMAPAGKLYSDVAGMTYGRSGVQKKLQQAGRRPDGKPVSGGTMTSQAASDVMYRTASRQGAEDLATSRRPELGNAFGAHKIYRAQNDSEILEEPQFQDDAYTDGEPGILNRPGFAISFLPNRNFLKTVESLESASEAGRRLSGDGEEEIQELMDGRQMPFSHDDLDLDDEDEDEHDDEMSTIGMFLLSAGLASYFHIFSQEKIDMHTLMIMSDNDFKELGLPFGPRKKLTEAIAQRKRVLEAPSRMTASAL